ncbi:MAG TPA: prepilin-type N-terminal cleavage/methylation domain-containing protein [Syntrophales bacterium]|nr:prepilin-type N-terminal cleavage/methylation domain-containing protein [Syntrophales bacterium]
MHEYDNSGFTLAELLVSMMIGLLILFAVYETFTVQNRSLKTLELKAATVQNARVGLDFIVRELRMAGYNPTDTINSCQGTDTATNTPCVGITSIAGDSISFTADLNGNGDLTPDSTNPDENIAYNVYSSGGIMYLGRTSNGSLQPVVMNITGLSFNYYDGSNQATTNLALIRKVNGSITATTPLPVGNRYYQTITFSSDIVPKCLVY